MSELALFKEVMKKRTKVFAHQCVKFALALPVDQLGNHIRGQLIRASTSVAANYRASCNALSIPVIITKMSISIEETDESEFWIEFAQDENITDNTMANALRKEALEIIAILTKARHTLQNKSK
jgi:four helix bundle protein